MAGESDEHGRLTRVSAFIFLHTEHAIYAALGLLLAVTAVLALIDAAGLTWEALHTLGGRSSSSRSSTGCCSC
jgi:hypothetical protein